MKFRISTRSRLAMKRAALACAGLIIAGASATGAYAQTAPATKDLFTKTCAKCHGVGGNGDGPSGKILNPPPESFKTALKGQSDDYLASVIRQGGGAFGLSPKMPAQPNLTDAQIKDLVAYIRQLGS